MAVSLDLLPVGAPCLGAALLPVRRGCPADAEPEAPAVDLPRRGTRCAGRRGGGAGVVAQTQLTHLLDLMKWVADPVSLEPRLMMPLLPL